MGGKKVGKGSVAYTDARKSAVTDSLTKASSLLGIGHSVFKGLRRADRQNTSKIGSGNVKNHSTNDEANATILWSLFNSQAKPAGVSRNDAAQLIDYDNWNKSCVDLRVLINKTQAVAVR